MRVIRDQDSKDETWQTPYLTSNFTKDKFQGIALHAMRQLLGAIFRGVTVSFVDLEGLSKFLNAVTHATRANLSLFLTMVSHVWFILLIFMIICLTKFICIFRFLQNEVNSESLKQRVKIW